MTLVIASQLDPALNAVIGRHPALPTVIAAPAGRPCALYRDADVWVVRPVPEWAADEAAVRPPHWPGRVRWVCTTTPALDVYPPWLFEVPVVTCARGIAAEDVADYVIAAIYRQAMDVEAAAIRGPEQWAQGRYLGQVAGCCVGILGLGQVGTAVARRATALGARVLAVRRSTASRLGVIGVEMRSRLSEVIREADHIVVALPRSSETRHLLDRRLLAQARPGAHLVNVSHGSIIKEGALIAALDSGILGFATLDATDPEPLPAGHPLYRHPRVLITPGIAAAHSQSEEGVLNKILANITRFSRGQRPTDVIERARG